MYREIDILQILCCSLYYKNDLYVPNSPDSSEEYLSILRSCTFYQINQEVDLLDFWTAPPLFK